MVGLRTSEVGRTQPSFVAFLVAGTLIYTNDIQPLLISILCDLNARKSDTRIKFRIHSCFFNILHHAHIPSPMWSRRMAFSNKIILISFTTFDLHVPAITFLTIELN
jgi:hypothetical protein